MCYLSQETMLKRIFFLMLFITTQAMGSVFNQDDIHRLKKNFFANFQANGAIVASPSTQEPNYYYDWVRDSALAMGLVESWYETNQSTKYKKYLLNYVAWTNQIQHQQQPGYDILGEPKFYIDGMPFDGPWGRPQNDGPALRASVLIRFAEQLLAQGERSYVQEHLYNSSMENEAMGVVKRDLEYVAHHWHEANFDLWEEISGHHFFTAMAQKNALLDGSYLAHQLHDVHAAAFYRQQADLIDARLAKHIDRQNKLIQSTLPPHAGPQKHLELDSSVILAILLKPELNDKFVPESTLVKHTVYALRAEFNQMFPINEHFPNSELFGRYPGDTYDGYHTNGEGNPWFILTATMAEYYFTLAYNLPAVGMYKPVVMKYINTGDNYLRLIKHYAPDMRLSEQVNLTSGVQQGAQSLTWSYTSVLRAIELRKKVQQKFML